MSTRSLRDRQPHPGRMFADTRLARNYLMAGDVSNTTKERFMRQTGRSLSGFGDVVGPAGPGGDPDTADNDVRGMEDLDDVFGSGVFDQPGAGPTANANMGILASYFSYPGYLAREVPHTVSKDEVDVTGDTSLISIPGGALPFVVSGSPAPSKGSPRDQTYVDLTGPMGPGVAPPLDLNPGGDYHSTVVPVPAARQFTRLPSPAFAAKPYNTTTLAVSGFGDAAAPADSTVEFLKFALVGAAIGLGAAWAYGKWGH